MTQPTIDELNAFLSHTFPEIFSMFGLQIEEVGAQHSRVRLPAKSAVLRAGGTVAGPTLMTLADTATYVTILGAIGCNPAAFTTSLHINFLRKAPPGDLYAHTRLLKVGRSLAVGEVRITPASDDAVVVATATVTYSLPN